MKQKLDEFSRMLEIIEARGVRSTLEIGSFDGESARVFSKVTNGRVVMVDPFLHDSFPENMVLINGFSQSGATLEKVAEYGPYDFIFIDGDHNRPLEDFDLYLQFLAPNGMMGIHDINPHSNIFTFKVPAAWDYLKQRYKTIDIISSSDLSPGYGIGLVFPFAQA